MNPPTTRPQQPTRDDGKCIYCGLQNGYHRPGCPNAQPTGDHQ